jgi:cytochrome P450
MDIPLLMLMDGPRHHELRELVREGLKSAGREAATLVEREAPPLLQELLTADECDLIDEFIIPVVTASTFAALGFESFDSQLVAYWASNASRLFDVYVEPSDVDRGLRAAISLALSVQSNLRSVDTGSDRSTLLHELVRHQQAGSISSSECLGLAVLTAVAAVETTVSLLATALYVGIAHGRMDFAGSDEVMSKFVAECLRWDSPVQLTRRFGGPNGCRLEEAPLQPGEPIAILIGAANRDPDTFAFADQFDINRRAVPHLAFGAGAHRCVGAGLATQLASAVLRVALPMLRGRSAVRSPYRLRAHETFRRLERLEVGFARG